MATGLLGEKPLKIIKKELMDPMRKKITLLIADEDRIIHGTSGLDSLGSGFEVLFASSEDQVLSHIEQYPIDLFFINCAPAIMQGLHVLKMIRSLNQKAHGILLNGPHSHDFMKEALQYAPIEVRTQAWSPDQIAKIAKRYEDQWKMGNSSFPYLKEDLFAEKIKLQKIVDRLDSLIQDLPEHSRIELEKNRDLKTAVEREIQEAKNRKETFALVAVSLNNSDQIRTYCGNDILTQVMDEIEKRLKTRGLRKKDPVFRLPPSELVIILKDTSAGDAQKVRQRFKKIVEGCAGINGKISFLADIGIEFSLYPDDAQNPEWLIQCALKMARGDIPSASIAIA